MSSLLAAGVAFLSSPLRVFAEWNKKAFTDKKMEDAIQSYFGTGEITPSDQVKLKAADIAENGAVVPVTVSSDMENIDDIAIVVENNPSPLAAAFQFTPVVSPQISTRIKMGKTSNVHAIVRSNGKLYSTSKEVKVTIGGCGG